ncbi:hypothetical protein GCM10023097_77590 [Streptomyces collinus]
MKRGGAARRVRRGPLRLPMRELAGLPASAVRRCVPFSGNAITRPLLRMRDVVVRGALNGLAAVPQLGVASLFVGDHAVQPAQPVRGSTSSALPIGHGLGWPVRDRSETMELSSLPSWERVYVSICAEFNILATCVLAGQHSG